MPEASQPVLHLLVSRLEPVNSSSNLSVQLPETPLGVGLGVPPELPPLLLLPELPPPELPEPEPEDEEEEEDEDDDGVDLVGLLAPDLVLAEPAVEAVVDGLVDPDGTREFVKGAGRSVVGLAGFEATAGILWLVW